MRKICFLLALGLASTMLTVAPTQAISLQASTTLPTAFPDDPNFNEGFGDGTAFTTNAKALYGQGTPQYKTVIQNEQAYADSNRQAAAQQGDNASYMYWSGYMTGVGYRS
jgi:hypothetical protein